VLRDKAEAVKQEAQRRAAEARQAAQEAKKRVDERLDENEFVQDAKETVDDATKKAKKSRLRKSLSGFADIMGQVFGAKKRRQTTMLEYVRTMNGSCLCRCIAVHWRRLITTD